MSTTTNIAEFGSRELEMFRDLFSAMIDQGLPADFYNQDVIPMLNKNSGCVFLSNSEYQVAMLNGCKLESFYTSPYEGLEGFYDELKDQFESMSEEDKEWFKSLKA